MKRTHATAFQVAKALAECFLICIGWSSPSDAVSRESSAGGGQTAGNGLLAGERAACRRSARRLA